MADRGKQWRRRLGAYAVLAALVSGLGLVVVPGTAYADIPCPNDPTIVWGAYGRTAERGWLYTPVSAPHLFHVVDGRIVQNNTDQTAPGTFVAQQSQTIQISVSVGSEHQLAEKLKLTVNSQIVIIRVTQIGVTTQLNIPPWRSGLGEYGLFVHDVTYDAQLVYWERFNRSRCWADPPQRFNTMAPTVIEGWRLSII